MYVLENPIFILAFVVSVGDTHVTLKMYSEKVTQGRKYDQIKHIHCCAHKRQRRLS
jgi:hypothetical protein